MRATIPFGSVTWAIHTSVGILKWIAEGILDYVEHAPLPQYGHGEKDSAMRKSSPTQKSLKRLRDAGYTVAVTEHWNAFAKIRQDLYGFIDLVALHRNIDGVLAVQVTTRDHMANRRSKILSLPNAHLWLACGNRILLHGWDHQILKEEEITCETGQEKK